MGGLAGASNRVVAHEARPRALPPSRLAPGMVVRTPPAAWEQGAAGGVEVVAVVVVAEQHRVDWAQVGGGDGRAGQLP
jgi:hypothetical protein